MPLMPGMLMSIRTRSGVSSATLSTDSSPVAASPTSSKPSARLSTMRAARRKGAWSSTTSTRTVGSIDRPSSSVTNRGGRMGPRGPGVGLASLPAQVEQDRLDPPVDVALLGEAELREDRVGVLLDRSLREDEGLGDRRVRFAGRHLVEDLGLPRGQTVEIGLRAGGSRRHELFDDLRIDDRAAVGDLADGVDQLVDVADPLLQQVGPALGPAREQVERVARARVLAEHDH